MINSDKIHISSITLLAACACNLSCKYCSIGTSKNEHTAELMKNNVTALEDGTYLKNVLAVMDRLNQNPNQINDLQIWGGEPTLVVGYLADRWSDWYRAFPQIRSIMYSTNGMEKVEDVLRFIKVLDENALQRINVTLQISYDGNYGEEIVRGGKCETIKRNYSWLAEQLKLLDLEKVTVDFQGHGVLSFELLESLKSIDDINKYVESINDFINLMSKKCRGNNVSFYTESLQWQNCGEVSSWEGADFRKKLHLMELTSKRDSSPLFERSMGIKQQVLGGAWGEIQKRFNESGCNTLDEFTNWVINTKQGRDSVQSKLYCSTTLHDLKVMYDGTVLMCQNDIFRIVNLDNTTSKSDAIHKTRLKHNQLVNFLTDSDDKINKYLYFIQSAKSEGFLTVYHSVCNMMYILASAGQISTSYLTDLRKLSNHALLICMMDACYHNTIGETGSTFLRGTSTIRLFANGVMDDMQEILLKYNAECKKITNNNCSRKED